MDVISGNPPLRVPRVGFGWFSLWCRQCASVSQTATAMPPEWLSSPVQAAYQMFLILSPIYTVIFITVRSVIGPPVFAWLIYHIMTAAGLPLPHR